MRVITIANGIRVSIGQYVKGIKLAKDNPGTVFKYGLSSASPCTGKEIMDQFYTMVQDHTNRGLVIRESLTREEYRRRAHRKGKITLTCKWCGAELTRDQFDFCSLDCIRAYRS